MTWRTWLAAVTMLACGCATITESKRYEDKAVRSYETKEVGSEIGFNAHAMLVNGEDGAPKSVAVECTAHAEGTRRDDGTKGAK